MQLCMALTALMAIAPNHACSRACINRRMHESSNRPTTGSSSARIGPVWGEAKGLVQCPRHPTSGALAERRRNHVRRGLQPKITQRQPQAIDPSQTLARIALGHRPGFERLAVHDFDVEHEPRRALDQNALNMARAPVDLRQPMRAGIWTYLRNRLGAMSRIASDRQALYLELLALCFERDSYCARLTGDTKSCLFATRRLVGRL
jgi:hypothetical protein